MLKFRVTYESEDMYYQTFHELHGAEVVTTEVDKGLNLNDDFLSITEDLFVCKDIHGEDIYTGDVVEVIRNDPVRNHFAVVQFTESRRPVTYHSALHQITGNGFEDAIYWCSEENDTGLRLVGYYLDGDAYSNLSEAYLEYFEGE